MNTFNLRLDLDKSSAIQVVTLRQGDVDGTTVSATVYDHGALADLSGISSAYIEFALPDGTHYYRGSAVGAGSGYLQIPTSNGNPTKNGALSGTGNTLRYQAPNGTLYQLDMTQV